MTKALAFGQNYSSAAVRRPGTRGRVLVMVGAWSAGESRVEFCL